MKSAIIIDFFTGRRLNPTECSSKQAAAVKKPTASCVRTNKKVGLGEQKQAWRKDMLAKIHIAKKRLNIDAENWRSMLFELFGVETSAVLSFEELDRFLAHLGKLGFMPTSRRPSAETKSQASLMKKIEALLAEKGRVEKTDMPWNYAVAIVKKQTGGKVSRLQDANAAQLRTVIAALVKDAQRKGRRIL